MFVPVTSSQSAVGVRLASGRGVAANAGFNHLTFPPTGSRLNQLINVTLGGAVRSRLDPPAITLGVSLNSGGGQSEVRLKVRLRHRLVEVKGQLPLEEAVVRSATVHWRDFELATCIPLVFNQPLPSNCR